ncbi:olfactory receptor 5AP2-like [Rhinophrynus dorsalis]
MDSDNHTMFSQFILVGLSEMPELQHLLFIVFLCIYVITVFGNMSMIFAYMLSPNLHTPMYFYLANFSFLEICYISSTLPKMLSNLIAEPKAISFNGCIIQMFWFVLLGGTECYMLAAMAYDRYNAICHPLLYNIIMNKGTCIRLIAGSWLIGAVNSLIHTVLTFSLSFCTHKINHFFCDIPPLLKLACTNTRNNELVLVVGCFFVIVGSFILTMSSYTLIIINILNIHSVSGRTKAFSTCTSHLMVVTIFYGSATFMYFRSKTNYVINIDKLLSVMYAVIVPLLNPFIYSLRNSDVKLAVRNIVYKRIVVRLC